MPLRYTDLDTKKSNYADFVIRRRFPTLLELFMTCVGAIVFGVAIALSVKDTIALCSLLFIFGGGMSLYVITQLNRSRDLLQATEFENALFASAMNLDQTFSLIVRDESTVVYVSPRFKELFATFAEGDSHDLKVWMDSAHMLDDERATITTALARKSKEELVCHLFAAEERRSKYRMRIEPIPRPKGFVLIRCREDTDV